ncbi:putative enoyl-[acyl-carrier-protein] reductase II [Ruegeria denitrificans]|uniref:Putative enoyl-[acyl-carrier-protein] reductase II n=2 Tax=Ruegeria denitrificans TaxID=1715692 RepID=A0A0P1IQY8_9RHOB|nr:putative enoyl-[acyl-carrier-protein] reductase II [Ruegeria denitrificans]
MLLEERPAVVSFHFGLPTAERLSALKSAGGIMDGFGIKSALDLGAVAAQLGTAFVACKENAANADYLKEMADETL